MLFTYQSYSTQPPAPIFTKIDFSGERPIFLGQSIANSTVIIEHGTFKYSSFTSTGSFSFTADSNDHLSSGNNIFKFYCIDSNLVYSEQKSFLITLDQGSLTGTFDFSNNEADAIYVLPKSSDKNMIIIGGPGNDIYKITKTRISDIKSLTIEDSGGINTIDVYEDLRSTSNQNISNAFDIYNIDSDGRLILNQLWNENGILKSNSQKMPQALSFLRDHGIDNNYKNDNKDNFDILFQVWKGSIPNLSINANGTLGLGSQSSDLLVGTSLKDVIFGGNGNDIIFGKAGNDQIDGGLGSDIAEYQGASSNYFVQVNSALTTVTDNKPLGEGNDTLTSIENIRFSDLTLDATSFAKTAALSAGQISSLVQLYIASFNRAPDSVGLDYWGGRLSDGMSLQDIAKSFFVQKETLAAYPTTMPLTDFVNTVYHNVLNRAADADGFNYWVGELKNGHVSKDSFLLAIINGAQAPSGAAEDRLTLANKQKVGAYYALEQGLNNSTNWAKDVMSEVNANASSVTDANTKTDHYAAIAADPATSDLVVKLVGIYNGLLPNF